MKLSERKFLSILSGLAGLVLLALLIFSQLRPDLPRNLFYNQKEQVLYRFESPEDLRLAQKAFGRDFETRLIQDSELLETSKQHVRTTPLAEMDAQPIDTEIFFEEIGPQTYSLGDFRLTPRLAAGTKSRVSYNVPSGQSAQIYLESESQLDRYQVILPDGKILTYTRETLVGDAYYTVAYGDETS